jgi:hypothetical protein
MKTLVVRMLSLILLTTGCVAVYAQDSRLAVPGDHFSLEGALELFKKSASPEEFEKLLNSAEAKVNNLDLNGDGDIDYIKVIDRQDRNVHIFILQAIVSETESQDVAVIELEKLQDGKAVLQITGDADVFGIETIIEPTEEVRVNAGTMTTRTVVNVWAWPSVQYVYSPYYSAWVSPWRWSYRPFWWSPWRPVAYYVYSPWWEPYRPYYSVCHSHRIIYARDFYRPYRSTSIVVYNRHQTQISNYRSSHQDARYSRGRDDDNRMNGRQNSSTYRNDVNDRQRHDSDQRGNSGSYTSGQGQRQNADRTRSYSSSSDNNSRSRASSPDYRSEHNSSQRNSGQLNRSDASRKWSGSVNANPPARQRNSQPSFNSRSSQRSTSIQPMRSGSSENRSFQRSGSGGGGSKASGQRRGRD